MSRPYSTTTTEEQVTPSALQVGGQLAGLAMGGMGLYDQFSKMGGGGTTDVPGAMYSPVPQQQMINNPFEYMRNYAQLFG